MALEIFSLFGSIFVDNEEANKSISKTEEKAGGLASKLGGGIKTAAKWSGALVAGAAAAGAAAFAMANKTTQGFDKISKNSTKLGITTDTYQEMSYWASQNGISSADMEKAVGRLNQRIGLALDGNTKYADGLEKMGVSMDDVRDGTVSTEEAMYTMIQSLSQMNNEQEKAAVASEVFGVKLARELMPALQDGSMSIDEAREAAERLGLVIGEEPIDAGVKFQDNLTDIKASLSAAGAQVMGGFIPIFNDVMDLFLENMPRIQDIVSKVFGALQKVVERVLPLLMDAVENALPPIIDMLTSLIEDVVPIIIDLVSDIIGNILPALIEYNQNIIGNILPVFIDLFKFIIEEVLPPVIELLMEIIEAVLPPFMKLFSEVISKLLPPLINLFKRLIEAVLPILIKVIDLIVEKVLPPFMELFVEIVDLILPPVIDIIEFLADEILPKLVDVFEWMSPLIEGWVNLIADVIGIAVSIIKGDWEGAWDGIENYVKHWIETVTGLFDNFKEVFSDIFEKIKEIVKGIWDGIVEDIKNSINFIIKSINVFIDGVNKIKIPDWVPDWMGGGKGINLPTIPLLAKGGEILERGKAIVGEAGAEMLELPKGAKVKPLGHESGGIVITGNNFYGVEDGTVKKIARELAKMVDEKKRKGLVTA